MTLLGRSKSSYLSRLEGTPIARTLPSPETSGYTPEQVGFAARAWTLKAEEEFRSAGVFAEMVGGFLDIGAPLDLLAALNRVVQDELQHTTLCHDLSKLFGGPAPVANTERLRMRVGQTPNRKERVVMFLLFEGAVGETISSTLFYAGRSAATEPCARAALHAILRDEAHHARLCWHAVAEMLPSYGNEEREAISRDLRRSFAAFEQATVLPSMRRLEAGECVDPKVFELGVIPPEVRVETFYRTLENVVLPRLEQLGLDGNRAWAERYCR